MRVQRRRRRDAAALDRGARPQRVGALLDDLAVEFLAAEPRAGIARDHRVEKRRRQMQRVGDASPACVTAVVGSAISRLSSAIGRGVVVMTCRGRSPRRSPNCSMSKVASAWRHLASSSHQAAANCGPRRLSGSSAENTCATAPFGHSSRRRDGIQCGRSPCRCTASRPDTPSTITSRTSCSVSPISAIGLHRERFAQCERLHPFGAGARLAGAAPAEQQPGGPVTGRLNLMRMREELPVMQQPGTLPWLSKSQQFRPQSERRQVHQFFAKARGGDRRCFGVARRRCRHPAIAFCPCGGTCPLLHRPLIARAGFSPRWRGSARCSRARRERCPPPSACPRSRQPASRRCATSARPARRAFPGAGSMWTPSRRRGMRAGLMPEPSGYRPSRQPYKVPSLMAKRPKIVLDRRAFGIKPARLRHHIRRGCCNDHDVSLGFGAGRQCRLRAHFLNVP